ncbi:NAD(P)-binding protein [Trematosphaeria pertusa]|uniref:NAD(P)-binding protein n=1 Tax=Trematosphaeria pertusa TaxID=390896 RepID=A0A6A6IEB4_9PLEO|nr:NAD(P)-binding protein [Trematosphaeria pertusa]KAF2247843.1 NAD(P)-binding protein [Trematosphaeria pertusa]
MSHHGTAFSTDQEARQKVLGRHVEQSGRFSPEATAEEVAAALARDIAGKTGQYHAYQMVQSGTTLTQPANAVIITGASPSGIGAEAARVIFKHNPKLLVLASRRKETIDETVAAIAGSTAPNNVKGIEMDLADLDSVREAAAEILKTTAVVDVLINNAGIMMLPKFTTTKQGVEMHFGVNHLGHFLFTNLLVPALLRSPAGASVVNVSSAGHQASPVHLEDVNFDNGKSYDPFVAYGQSKTANILFSVSLTDRLKTKGLRSFSLDPGAVPGTALSREIPFEKRVAMGWWKPDGSLADNIPWTSVAAGASTYVVTGFDRTIDDKSGKCFAKNNVDPTTASHALDSNTADKLWALSEKLVGQEFRYD